MYARVLGNIRFDCGSDGVIGQSGVCCFEVHFYDYFLSSKMLALNTDEAILSRGHYDIHVLLRRKVDNLRGYRSHTHIQRVIERGREKEKGMEQATKLQIERDGELREAMTTPLILSPPSLKALFPRCQTRAVSLTR